MRAGLAIIAAVGGLALTGASEALADPIPSPIQVAPDDGTVFTARADQITFKASTEASPPPAQIDFYISRSSDATSGILSSRIDSLFAGPDASDPPVYEAGPDSDTN